MNDFVFGGKKASKPIKNKFIQIKYGICDDCLEEKKIMIVLDKEFDLNLNICYDCIKKFFDNDDENND